MNSFNKRPYRQSVLTEQRQKQYEIAVEMLDLWLAAEKALTTGKTYTIGTRSLTRVDLDEVAERINYWTNEIARLDNLLNGRRGRAWRIVPRDL